MSINLKIDGDPAGIRQVSEWVKRAAAAADRSAQEVHRAGAESRGDWRGEAGDGFRLTTTKARQSISNYANDADVVAKSIENFGTELEGLQRRMGTIRELAAKEGLETTKAEIRPPGDAPQMPTGPHTLDSPVRKKYEHDLLAYNKKVAAYNQATKSVTEVRAEEMRSGKSLLDRLAKSVSSNSVFHMSNVVAGVAGLHVVNRRNHFRNLADKKNKEIVSLLNRLDGDWKNRNIAVLRSEVPSHHRGLLDHAEKKWQQRMGLPEAGKTSRLANAVDPNWLERTRPELYKLGRGTSAAGWVIASGQTYSAIRGGQDPTHAVASGVGSVIVSGAVTGATYGSVGGPAAVAIGAIAGGATGFIIDEFGDDFARKLSENTPDIESGLRGLVFPRYR